MYGTREASPSDPAGRLERLVSDLGQAGREVLYCDLTPPDVRELGVCTLRAIVPDLLPIHFSLRERRLGSERLFSIPCRLGLRPSPTSVGELNPHPHPFA